MFRDRADAMAAGLAALGVAPGDHVAVHSRDALTTAVAMFAIWRAGAVFAPVNYNLTGDFLTYQLADTAPKVLIADAAGVAAIAARRTGTGGVLPTATSRTSLGSRPARLATASIRS